MLTGPRWAGTALAHCIECKQARAAAPHRLLSSWALTGTNHTRRAGPSKGIAKVHATNQCLQNGKSAVMGHTGGLTRFQATETSRSGSHNISLFCELSRNYIFPNTSPAVAFYAVRQVPVFHHGSNADKKKMARNVIKIEPRIMPTSLASGGSNSHLKEC